MEADVRARSYNPIVVVPVVPCSTYRCQADLAVVWRVGRCVDDLLGVLSAGAFARLYLCALAIAAPGWVPSICAARLPAARKLPDAADNSGVTLEARSRRRTRSANSRALGCDHRAAILHARVDGASPAEMAERRGKEPHTRALHLSPIRVVQFGLVSRLAKLP